MTQPTQRIVLHLSQLKQLRVVGVCELFDLIEAAPNLDDLSIQENDRTSGNFPTAK